jgi:predicted transcriptional regulator
MSASMTVPGREHAFRLDQRGLARVFGELEAAVMEAVWALGQPTVAQVCVRLGAGSNYKTVMTVMNRLVEKRVLTRRRRGRAFVYAAVETRDAFVERLSRRVVEGLVQDFGDLAVAQFVDALDAVDPALLDQLARLVREHEAGGGEP